MRRPRGSILLWGAVTAALLGVLVWVLVQFAPEAVPRKLTMSTGAPGGMYAAVGERYRAELAAYGIDLELRPSAGAAENLDRLRDRASGVDVAFVQSGLATRENAPGLNSLGAVFYEPIWLFYRGAATVEKIAELRGKRVAIGAPGSGTYAAGRQMAADNDLAVAPTTLVELGGAAAAQALIDGKVDAVFMISALEGAAAQRLLTTPGIRLMNMRRADAYTRRLPFLHKLELPEGVIDLSRNLPPQPVTLVAVTADLVAHEDLHPVLVQVLLEAARRVNGGPSLLAPAGTFPAAMDHLLPIDSDADRFYRDSPSFLRRVLPFWAAVWVERALFVLLPLLAIAIPVVSYLPQVYAWRVRGKMHRWYGELYLLERDAGQGSNDARLARLAQIEAAVNRLHVPKGYLNELYTLREHTSYVRQLLLAQRAG